MMILCHSRLSSRSLIGKKEFALSFICMKGLPKEAAAKPSLFAFLEPHSYTWHKSFCGPVLRFSIENANILTIGTRHLILDT